jgi:hypothetical protein
VPPPHAALGVEREGTHVKARALPVGGGHKDGAAVRVHGVGGDELVVAEGRWWCRE